jgi:hypothetical protein
MEIIVTVQAPLVPRLSWLVDLGQKFGAREATVLSAVWICLVIASCGTLVGFCCRTSAISGWFLHLCATKSAGLFTYGMDDFTTIGLFYLILAPLPDRWALDHKLRKFPIKDRHLHGFFRRVLQLHLCVIYFFGGITKFFGSDWWNGESLWRALTRAPFNVLPTDLIISWHGVLPVAGIAVCLLEIGYTIFIWLRRTRLSWLIAIICMHFAIGLALGLYLFASIMIVLNLAAFGPDILFPERREAELDTGTAKANSSKP